jgi:hypothetical protein
MDESVKKLKWVCVKKGSLLMRERERGEECGSRRNNIRVCEERVM